MLVTYSIQGIDGYCVPLIYRCTCIVQQQLKISHLIFQMTIYFKFIF